MSAGALGEAGAEDGGGDGGWGTGPPTSVIPQKAALCGEIVREQFGEVAGEVVEYVLGHGSQNIPDLLRMVPGVSKRKLHNALKVLVQHNCVEPCVYMFTTRGVKHKVVEYRGLPDSILRRTRVPQFLDRARSRCGPLAADLMEIIFLHGRVSLHQLVEYALHKFQLEGIGGGGEDKGEAAEGEEGPSTSDTPAAKRGRKADGSTANGAPGNGAPANGAVLNGEGGASAVSQWHLRVVRAFESLVRERFVEQSPRWGAHGLVRSQRVDVDAEGVPPPSAPRKKGRASERAAAEAVEARKRKEAADRGMSVRPPLREEYQLPTDFHGFVDGLAAQVGHKEPPDGIEEAPSPKIHARVKVKTEPDTERRGGRSVKDGIKIEEGEGSAAPSVKERKTERANLPEEFHLMEDWEAAHPRAIKAPVKIKKEPSAPAAPKVEAEPKAEVTIENFSELWRVSLVEFVRRERHAVCCATVAEKFGPLHGKAIEVLLDMARPYETAIRAENTARCTASQLLREIQDRHARAKNAGVGGGTTAGTHEHSGSVAGTKRKHADAPSADAETEGLEDQEGSPMYLAEFESFDESEMERLLEVIVRSSVGFMDRALPGDTDEEGVEVSGRGSKALYTLRLGRIVALQRQRFTECEVLCKFGINGCRIFRILLKLRMLEQKTITEKAMLPMAETRELLYRMLPLEYVSLQEISRTPEHAPSRSFYLWTVQMNRVVRAVQGGLFQVAMRLRQRLAQELKAERKLVELVESTDPGGITIAQASEEHEKLMRVEKQLSVQLARLDPMIALFNDF